MHQLRFTTASSLAFMYCKDTRAAIAPIMAVMLTALLSVILFTFDVRRIMDTNQKVQAIADAVALEAIQTVGAELQASGGEPIEGDTLQAIRTRAREGFITRLQNTDISLLQLSTGYVNNAPEHSIEIAYEVSIDSLLLPFIMPQPKSRAAPVQLPTPDTIIPTPISQQAPSNRTVTIAKRSVAAVIYSPVSYYMHFNLLIDVSGSMSTGATYADQVALWETQQCSFACHMDNINDAKDDGIKMRYEILIDSLEVLYDQAETTIEELGLPSDALSTQFFYFRDSHFQHGSVVRSVDRMPPYLRLQHLMLPTLIEVRENTDPDTDGQGNTNLEFALTSMAEELNNGGTGSGPNDRQNFVFMITDGIGSEGALDNDNDEGIGTLQTQFCDAIKNKNATLAVILLEYPDYAETMRDALGPTLPNDHPHDSRTYAQWSDHFDDFVADPLDSMEVVMHNCSTEGFYYQASNPVELNEAMRELLSDAMPSGNLSPFLRY